MRRLCAWVHARWDHDGWNEPSASDPLTILEGAAQGKLFRCVEYGIVIAACASALGLPSRVLELKTEDAQTREFGAGHVVSEVFLPDLKCWAFVDGQWNVIPMHGTLPLSGAEFRSALNAGGSIASFSTVPEETVCEYLEWIDEYLFYFSAQLDNRSFGTFAGARLMLGPTGVKAPTRRFSILDTRYTHSVRAFYPQP